MINSEIEDDIQSQFSFWGGLGDETTYQVIINGDGHVSIKGDGRINREQAEIKSILQKLTAEQFSEITDMFDKSDFFALKDRYDDDGVTDASASEISYTYGSVRKSVYVYGGCLMSMEESDEYYGLRDKIVEITGVNGWLEEHFDFYKHLKKNSGEARLK